MEFAAGSYYAHTACMKPLFYSFWTSKTYPDKPYKRKLHWAFLGTFALVLHLQIHGAGPGDAPKDQSRLALFRRHVYEAGISVHDHKGGPVG